MPVLTDHCASWTPSTLHWSAEARPTALLCCPGEGFQIPEDKQVSSPKRLKLLSQGASVSILSITLYGRAGDTYFWMTKLRFGRSSVQLTTDLIVGFRFVSF